VSLPPGAGLSHARVGAIAHGVWLNLGCAALGATACPTGVWPTVHAFRPRSVRARRGISNTAGTLAGVIGVAATGRLLQAAGGAEQRAGWYNAVGLAAAQCVLGSGVFLAYARGERLFGGDTADFQE